LQVITIKSFCSLKNISLLIKNSFKDVLSYSSIINRITFSSESQEVVKDFMSNIFDIHNQACTEKIKLLNPMSKTMAFNDYDQLDSDFDKYQKSYITSSKILFNSRIFQSRVNPKLNKLKSCYESFQKGSQKCFGEIQFFVESKDIYASINILNFSSFFFGNILGKCSTKLIELKNDKVFDRFYFVFEKTNIKTLIKAKYIQRHCFALEIDDEKLVLSEDLIDSEHD
jgi:hypothetical protein